MAVRLLLQRGREDYHEHRDNEEQHGAQIQPIHASELAYHHGDEAEDERLDDPQKYRRGIL